MMKMIPPVLLVALATFAVAFDPLSEDMVHYVNNVVKPSWTAEKQTRFESLDALRSQLGAKLKRNYSKQGKVVPLEELENDDDLPEEFDSRVQWPHCPSIQQIRDQSTCGSCWAFGAATAMSDRICIHSNGALTPTISAEDLLTCCESCGNGCYGGYPLAAWNYFRNNGLVTGGPYGDKKSCRPYAFPHCNHHEGGPYQPCGPIKPTPECLKTCQKGYYKSYAEDKFKAKTAYEVQRGNIRREIYTNGPVEAAFEVHLDFPHYKSGVYVPTVPQVEGGHAIRIIGWGVENGVKYWLVANSWNPYWGDKGLFKIKRGEDTCGIESEVVAGIPAV